MSGWGALRRHSDSGPVGYRLRALQPQGGPLGTVIELGGANKEIAVS
jgi:hypothetical protein